EFDRLRAVFTRTLRARVPPLTEPLPPLFPFFTMLKRLRTARPLPRRVAICGGGVCGGGARRRPPSATKEYPLAAPGRRRAACRPARRSLSPRKWRTPQAQGLPAPALRTDGQRGEHNPCRAG